LKISIIVPVYNEVESLSILADEIQSAMDSVTDEFEIIIVDDGSTDGSPTVIEELCEKHAYCKAIILTRNYGKSAAYMAGFDLAQGETIITLDADLQDNPAEIPRVLQKLKKGFDLVIGWKKGRINNEWYKTVPSKVYNRIKAVLFGIPLTDSNSGFRAMNQAVAKSLDLYGDRYRFIPELSHLNGFKVGEIPVRHRKRKFGESKYGPTRFYTGIMDLISVRFLSHYSSKPLHFFGLIALPLLFLGGCLELYVLIQKLMGSMFRTHIAALIIGVLFILVGVQFLILGLLGEMITSQTRRRELPSIKSTIGFSE